MQTNKRLYLWIPFLIISNNTATTSENTDPAEVVEIVQEVSTVCQNTENAPLLEESERMDAISDTDKLSKHTQVIEATGGQEQQKSPLIPTQEDEKTEPPIVEVTQGNAPDCITICNAITDQSKKYTCKWGTFAPDEFSVRLIIDFDPNQTISVPKEMIKKGKIQAEYNFAFSKGIASRKGKRAQVLTTTNTDAKQDLLFSWDEPRFQLHAKKSALR